MIPSTLSERILYLREKHNLTYEEVGKRVGVSKSTVHKWETGSIENMRRDKIAKLAAALDTTPGYLMGWDDPEDLTLTQLSIASVSGLQFFSNLKYERDLRNEDPAVIADAIGISLDDYFKIESGNYDVPLSIAAKLAHYFNCGLDYIVGFDGTFGTRVAYGGLSEKKYNIVEKILTLSDDQIDLLDRLADAVLDHKTD